MKILLCDDEPIIRLGLRSMLEELYPGEHEFTEAANGDELVALAAGQPAIAFVDIQMPGTDGLSAIARAKDISPQTRWLLLTGHSDFSYAQTGLRLGVADYLLKPIGKADLRRVVNAEIERATKRQAKQVEAQNQQLYLRMTTLFRRFQTLGEVPPPERPAQSYALCLLYLDHRERGVRIQQLRALEKTVRDCLASAACPCALFYLSDSELCLVMQHDKAEALAAVLEETAAAQHTVTAIWCAGITGEETLPEISRRIMDKAPLRSVWCFGKSVELRALEELPGLEKLITLAEALDGVCLAFLAGDEVGYRKAVDEFARLPEDVTASRSHNAMCAYLQVVLQLNGCGESWQALQEALLHHLPAMYTDLPKQQNRDLVAQIQKYVQNHYMEDIGVNSIADTLDITPNYLSRIFHQKAGVRFIDYLSETRVAAAKRMLAESEGVSVKETAEKVGYFSTRHFTKVFVKFTGATPSEYQKSHLAGAEQGS